MSVASDRAKVLAELTKWLAASDRTAHQHAEMAFEVKRGLGMKPRRPKL